MKTRDLMAPDTDPTDEELESVARTALEIAMERKANYDNWVTTALEQASWESDKNRLHRRTESDDGQ